MVISPSSLLALALLGIILMGLAAWLFLRPRRTAFPAEDRTLPLQSLLAEAQKLVRTLDHAPHSAGYERLRALLREMQRRLRQLPPEAEQRFERRAMRVLEDAARIGVTLSPEETLQQT